MEQPKCRSVELVGEWPTEIGKDIQYYLGSDIDVRSTNAYFQNAMMPWADLEALISAAAASITLCLSLWDRLSTYFAASPSMKKEKRIPLKKSEVTDLKRAINERGIFGVDIQRISAMRDSGLKVEIYHEVSAESFHFQLSLESNKIFIAIDED
jgi:hypothetical protein